MNEIITKKQRNIKKVRENEKNSRRWPQVTHERTSTSQVNKQHSCAHEKCVFRQAVVRTIVDVALFVIGSRSCCQFSQSLDYSPSLSFWPTFFPAHSLPATVDEFRINFYLSTTWFYTERGGFERAHSCMISV